mmetsp:Transcript_33928/g.96115  ORF Transcript_33928/g.96115 Transcript_33928/m.96115 type:complete len:336 (+) Transcript_33928:254-1261(+)
MAAQDEAISLRITTLNLRGVSDRWAERQTMLQALTDDLDADVYAFQEVLTGEFEQDCQILGPQYQVHPCKAAMLHLHSLGGAPAAYARMLEWAPSTRLLRSVMVGMPVHIEGCRESMNLKSSCFRLLRDLSMLPFFGNSIATKLPSLATAHETLPLGEFRAAHRVCLECSFRRSATEETEKVGVWVVNTHLHHDDDHPEVRSEQMDRICRWVEESTDNAAGVLIAGDLNSMPSEELHAVMKSFGYRSAYAAIHGREPEATWPSGLIAPLMDEGPPGCLDYIYVKGLPGWSVNVQSASLAGHHPCPGDSTLYPSDHLAVHVGIRVKPVTPSSAPRL